MTSKDAGKARVDEGVNEAAGVDVATREGVHGFLRALPFEALIDNNRDPENAKCRRLD